MVCIAILGFAFKKDTNDTRESASIYVCRHLLQEQAHLAIYDPRVPEDEIRAELEVAAGAGGKLEICSDPYEATQGAHAAAVLTEWDEFVDLDYERIYGDMLKPAFVFDGRNVLDIDKLKAIGFQAQGIGKG